MSSIVLCAFHLDPMYSLLWHLIECYGRGGKALFGQPWKELAFCGGVTKTRSKEITSHNASRTEKLSEARSCVIDDFPTLSFLLSSSLFLFFFFFFFSPTSTFARPHPRFFSVHIRISHLSFSSSHLLSLHHVDDDAVDDFARCSL